MEGIEKICVFNGKLAMSQKWWKTPPRLLSITNRKWHMPFHTRWKSLTLDDPEGQW